MTFFCLSKNLIHIVCLYSRFVREPVFPSKVNCMIVITLLKVSEYVSEGS